MLSCCRLDRTANVEFLKLEVILIYPRETVESATMDPACYLHQSSDCCDVRQTTWAAFGHYHQQVRFTSLFRRINIVVKNVGHIGHCNYIGLCLEVS